MRTILEHRKRRLVGSLRQGTGKRNHNGKRSRLSKSTNQGELSGSKLTLRDRVWDTAFQWAKQDLGTDKKIARQIADAAVEDLDCKTVYVK